MKISMELKEENKIVAKARQHTLNLWVGGATAREQGLSSAELLTMALGSCMMGTLQNFSVNQGYEISSIQFDMEYEESQHPAHISKINIKAEIEGDLSTKEIDRLKRAATHCKIHNTLMQVPEINFTISYSSIT